LVTFFSSKSLLGILDFKGWG